MTLQLGDIAPDFEADTTEGRVRFHDWLGNSWGVIFSHPKDFTPVCTTELGYMAKIKPEFDKRGVKIIGLSVDPIDLHKKWADDIKETQGVAPNFPMIGDPDLSIAKLYGMLPASTTGTSQGRTAADNYTVRNVFVIGPDKKIKLILVYPMTTGRNFDEVLRVIDSMQLTAKHKVATPVNWKAGEDVIIADHDFAISKAYGMLGADVSGDPKDRTAADNQTVRNVFVIGPDKKVKLVLVYPMTTGRNFDEVLRVIDSLQLTASHKVSTPANWKQGDDVIIAGSVSNDEAKELFGEWEEPKPYIRIVPQPEKAA